MTDTLELEFTKACKQVAMPETAIISLIENGLIEPEGNAPDEWILTQDMMGELDKACQLRNELGIDWQGVAHILQVVNERDVLRKENARLRQRLQHFIDG